MTAPVQIIGSYLSPYVRKVLVCLDLKGIAYEIDPIIPFIGDDRFSKLSPLRRIPVYSTARVTLADSSVICQYLEDRTPSPRSIRATSPDRARARWLEEFADTRMGDVFIWRLFNQVTINPRVWGEKTDAAILKQTLEVDLPDVLDHLEAQLPAVGFLFGEVSIADVSIACFFRNAAFARYAVDAGALAPHGRLRRRVLAAEPFQHLAPFEERMLRTPIAKQRAALAEMGAPLSAESHATPDPAPRRDVAVTIPLAARIQVVPASGRTGPRQSPALYRWGPAT